MAKEIKDFGKIENLAKVLHEAGREAVLKSKTVNPNVQGKFLEWDEITEDAREGRRIQAKFLLDKYVIYPKKPKQQV